jgi:hypothetical protein
VGWTRPWIMIFPYLQHSWSGTLTIMQILVKWWSAFSSSVTKSISHGESRGTRQTQRSGAPAGSSPFRIISQPVGQSRESRRWDV